MTKILSQTEIDALLSTVSDGDKEAPEEVVAQEDTRPTILYDFKHPNRVSKDQIRTLENLHDNLAGQYGSTLSAILRSVVDVDLVSVDQITYSEFIMSLMTPSCTYTYKAPPLNAVCLVDFSPTLTFALIDRMFGGHGKILESDRELTGIERAVIGRLVGKLYRDIEKAWEAIIALSVEQASLETNPHFIQIVPPGETVIVVSFQIKLFQSTGLLTLCYPYVSLEPVVTKLSAQNWIDATKKTNRQADQEVNLDNVQLVTADLRAELLHTNIRMRDFLNLATGDILPSDKNVREPVMVYVNRKKKFLADPGVSGRKRAFQIVSECDIQAKER